MSLPCDRIFFFIWNKKCRYWHFKSIVTTVFSMGRSVFLPKEKRKNTYINFKLHPILWYWIIDLGHRDGPYFLHNCYCDNSKSQVEKRHKSFLTNSFVDRFISGKYLAAQMCEFLSIMLSVFDQLNILKILNEQWAWDEKIWNQIFAGWFCDLRRLTLRHQNSMNN